MGGAEEAREPPEAAPRARDEVVAAIEAAEARKAVIQATWCEARLLREDAEGRDREARGEEKALGPKIDALLAEWESLEAELAALP